MKTKVFQKREEFSKIVDESFKIMIQTDIVFPISNHQRGLRSFFYEGQQKALPIERRATFGSDQRKKFISGLNYRYIKYLEITTKDQVSKLMTHPTATLPQAKKFFESDLPKVVYETDKPISTNVKKATELGALVRAMDCADLEFKAAFITSYMS